MKCGLGHDPKTFDFLAYSMLNTIHFILDYTSESSSKNIKIFYYNDSNKSEHYMYLVNNSPGGPFNS